MWIVKGVFIGFGLFLAGLVLTAIVSISFAFGRGQVQAQHATSLGVIYAQTFGSPFFYLVLLGCILIGIAVAGSCAKPVH
jgi:cell division protein FtsX